MSAINWLAPVEKITVIEYAWAWHCRAWVGNDCIATQKDTLYQPSNCPTGRRCNNKISLVNPFPRLTMTQLDDIQISNSECPETTWPAAQRHVYARKCSRKLEERLYFVTLICACGLEPNDLLFLCARRRKNTQKWWRKNDTRFDSEANKRTKDGLETMSHGAGWQKLKRARGHRHSFKNVLCGVRTNV